ncbi:hypothetical protein ABK040_003966 [Willaertia magna]
MKDYYKLLGVAKNCSQKEIRKAYLLLAKQYHPDTLLKNDPKFYNYEKQFKEITEAYSILGDPRQRLMYNKEYFGSATLGMSEQDKDEFYEEVDNYQEHVFQPLNSEENVYHPKRKEIIRRKIRRLFIVIAVLGGLAWYFKLKFIFLRMYNRDVQNKVIYKDKEGTDADMIKELNRKFAEELKRVKEEREKLGVQAHPVKNLVSVSKKE